MLDVVLYQPEIPPNTGNVIRLCANTGVALHLVHPLGFVLEDARLRRAGLDYREWARVHEHASWPAYLAVRRPARVLALSTRGSVPYTDVAYRPGDTLLFGPETRGLPAELLASVPPEQRLRIPMVPGSRSLNLSNAVAVVVYEAWRQQGFAVQGGPR
jgi:tRNA (cytidine/uridine-2'-O-)-methyltransferase